MKIPTLPAFPIFVQEVVDFHKQNPQLRKGQVIHSVLGNYLTADEMEQYVPNVYYDDKFVVDVLSQIWGNMVCEEFWKWLNK